ncbi:MAG: hypothetical protein Q4G35_11220 [Propionibacteriaceae bacterium]|nr:hypothetical protein [Propionibacteriaceae bacterium]
MPYDALITQDETITNAANAACDAAQQLARLANGNRSHLLPAPTAYTILGNLKVLLGHLNEVVDFVPRGLNACRDHPDITITDASPSGVPRKPETSVKIASDALAVVYSALARALKYAELAQQAINGQGYEPCPSSKSA